MKGKALALVTLLALAAGLAGCLGGAVEEAPLASASSELEPLTGDAYTFGDFLPVKAPGWDGTPIHLDIQLPNGTGPFPILVQYTPYSNNLNADDEAWGVSGETGAGAVNFALADSYVPKGYAVAIAHVRGSGQSGGCFTTGGADEAKDGYAIVEWLANQSWSNGRVALMGTSYVGTTPISTATLNPPHLTTIVPVSAVSEWYRYYFENGEPRFFGELPFGVVYTDQPLWMGIGFLPKPRNPTGTDPGHAACAKAQSDNAYLQDDYNDYWMERNYVKDLANATAPMLYAHGFLDENTPTSLVTDFYNAYPGEKRMWLQQHGHGVPASFEAYHEAVHRWLDFHMLGRENGALLMPPVTLQDNRGAFHTLPEWPLRAGESVMLHLGEGKLLVEAPADATQSYRDLPVAMEEIRQKLPGMGGYLRFETEPLDEPMHISGAPRVELVASSTAADTQFAALLYDVAPDGTETFLTRGYLDARHRDGLEKGEDLAPGQESLFQWEMHSRDHHLEEGHRLVLVVASTDKYVLPDAPGAENTLRYGPAGSRLVLPVLDLAATEFSDEPWRLS